MPIQRSNRPVAAARMARLARQLLDAAPLCAIATVAPRGRAHVNTAYFAWSPDFEIVWLSAREARHSRNLDASASTAIAVFASNQTWGQPDRGIQLFGSAAEAAGDDAEALYADRFPAYRHEDLGAYRFYRFRPSRLKLFDERELGTGVFVTARVVGGGGLVWRRTDVYRGKAG